MKKKKVKKWIRFRHKAVTGLLKLFLIPYVKMKYHIKIEKFKQQKGRQFLVLANHQTAFDQFFVAKAFKGSVYYVASEDIFSLGFTSKLIKYLVAPIPIRKQTTDVSAVLACNRVAKEGGTIAIFPEGNRTYSGKTEYINPAIGGLARLLKLPIAIFRIEGGYGVHPRWSDVVRKGKMRAYVSTVIEPEEFAAKSNEEVLAMIEKELYVDEGCECGKFVHKQAAEYMERAIYVCPYCGLSEFESHGDIIECKKCNRQIRYTPTKTLEGIGFEFPFRFTTEWYRYQTQFVAKLDISPYALTPIYKNEGVELSEVLLYKKKVPLCNSASIAMFNDRVEIFTEKDVPMVLPFENTRAITVLGKNKLNIYYEKKVYQIKADERFNALKYVNLFYHYRNIQEGKPEDEFLGL